MLPNRPIDLGEFRGHRVLLVPVADLPVEELEPTWGPGGRSKSASYEALAESVWRFQREVLPEMLQGISVENLSRKYPTVRPDGLLDWSSASTVVLELFNGDHGVVVNWCGDKWIMEGGRHRLDLARKLGMSHMPVAVRNRNLPEGLMPLVLVSHVDRHSGPGAHFDGGGQMSGQTRVTPGELEDFARKFQARARDIDDRLQSIRDGLRALSRTFDDPDFVRFHDSFERSSRSISEFTEFSGTEANRMLLMAEDARRKEQVAKGGA
jgi:uncharacterized protein YukE